MSNFSSEASDSLDYLSTQYFGNSPPPFFRQWNAEACGQTFLSRISQADAEQQAAAAAALCADTGPCIGAGCPTGVGGGPLCNNAQTSCVPCPDGTLFCYTVPAGVFCGYGNQGRADSYAHGVAFRLARERRFCLSKLNASGCVGQPYSQSVTATGPVITPCTWTVVSGVLPPGLTLGGFSPNIDTTLGPTETIQGNPTTAGSYTFTLQCEGSDFSFMQKQYTICITSIGPTLLPNGTLNAPYSQVLNDAGACFSSPTWSIASGSLPNGLTLNSTTGLISGTPTQSGTFTFTAQETAGSISCSKTYSLIIGGVTCPNILNVQNVATLFNNPCPGQLASVPGFFLWNGILVLQAVDCSPAPCSQSGIYLNNNVPGRFPGTNNSEMSGGALVRPRADLLPWTCTVFFTAGSMPLSGTGWGMVIVGTDVNTGSNDRVWSGSNGSTSPTGVYTSDGLGCLNVPTLTVM